MAVLRPLVSVLLSLVLLASSVTMAVARGNTSQLHHVVICSGYGVITITVDADGNPTGPVHPCPDCVQAVAGLGPVDPTLPAAAQITGTNLALPEIPLPRSNDALPFRARAPPLPV